jgi:hypothetical protein
MEKDTMAKQKECNALKERCASLEAQNNALQQRLNDMQRKEVPRDKRDVYEVDAKAHASKPASGLERVKSSRDRSLPQPQCEKPKEEEEMPQLRCEQQSLAHAAEGTRDAHGPGSARDAGENEGPSVWSNGVFDTKRQAPVEFVMQNLAQNLRDGFLGACVQGAPCSGIDVTCEQDVSGEMHHSVGEVCIAEFASPRPQNRYRTSQIRAPSPSEGAKRVDTNAPLAAVPMQVCSTQCKEVITVGEKGNLETSDFLDDVKLRADALRSSGSTRHSVRHLARDGCCIEEEEEEFPTACEDDVIADLNRALQGLPADASGFGNSLDESMSYMADMGTSVDEGVSGVGFSVPDLPISRLGENRASAPSAVTKLQQPPRTIFFPQPPVHSSPLVYHSGHYQGWSQRSSKRGASPI